MRILHLAEAFGGGLMRMVIAVAEGSAAAGHEVMIAHGVRPETPTDLRARIDDAVEVRRLPWTSRRPGPQLRGALEVRALLREWQPDVVHLHSSFAGFAGALAAGDSVPTVFTPNAFASSLPEGAALRRWTYRLAERVACRRVTLVGAVSHSEADIARELGARWVVRVPNGVPELDPGRVRTRGPGEAPSRPPVVVASGRTVPQRRPAACARILAQVRDLAEVAWLGGGGGGRGTAGRDALEAAGVPISGWLPQEELLARVAGASAYLHFTAWDGLPLSVLEAVALDVPVVASDIPPNREILGEAGVFASEHEAAQALRRIVTDPSYAEHLLAGQRGRRGEFSARAMLEGWERVYAGLVAGSP